MSEAIPVEEAKQKKQKQYTSQIAFKYASLAIIAVCVYCMNNLLTFRSIAISKGILVFQYTSLIYIVPGFFAIAALKVLIYKILSNQIIKLVRKCSSQTISEQEFTTKQRRVKKTTIDIIVHTIFIIVPYSLFRNQYWFSYYLGGNGDHNQGFRQLPNWPSHKSLQIQIFYMIQFGINLFHLVDLIVYWEDWSSKFYQMFLHHITAIVAIIFNAFGNLSTIGVLMFLVHDFSDFFRAVSQLYKLLNKAYDLKLLAIEAIFLIAWIYTRIVIFPYCLIYPIEKNLPKQGDQLYIIRFEYQVMIAFFCTLYSLHVFWTYLQIRLFYRSYMFYKQKNVAVQQKKSN